MVTHGKDGKVKIGAATLGKVQSYVLDETGETVDATSMGDQYASELVGIPRWTVAIELMFDKDDPAQGQIAFNALLDVELYPVVEAAGNPYRTGQVRVSNISETVRYNDAVRQTIQCTGQGELQKPVVA